MALTHNLMILLCCRCFLQSRTLTFLAGNEQSAVTTDDLNGDGVLDLITANGALGTVSVLLGVGDGTFGVATSYVVGVGAEFYTVTTGDLNNDGVLDLVTADSADDSAVVFLGVGDGTFGAATSFAVWSAPSSVTTGDFNGDGVLDLVTAGEDGDDVSVLLGVGDGTFSTATSFGVGSVPRSVTTGDFNGDGILDLVTADEGDDAVSVLLGVGDGTFGPATSYTVGDGPRSIITGDFNGDGMVDLVTADYGDAQVSVLLGVGDGTFGASTSVLAFNQPYSVTTGDFNGDGVLDLVTADNFDHVANVLLGTTTDGVAPLLEFSLATMADARQVLPVFRRKLEQLSLQRGEIGAFLSRVTVASSVLGVSAENSTAAASRIEDADMASESANLVRLRILQQAATAVLSQANQQPDIALQLLT